MPSVQSSVETHPQRDQIITALRSGVSLKSIAVTLTPKISVMALWRYRKNVMPSTAAITNGYVNSTSCVSKPWVEQEYVSIYNAATCGKRKDLPSARAALDSIARLNGYDAPRRTESVTMNFHALPPAQLAQQLQALLGALPESERQSLGPVVDINPDPKSE